MRQRAREQRERSHEAIHAHETPLPRGLLRNGKGEERAAERGPQRAHRARNRLRRGHDEAQLLRRREIVDLF